MPGLNEVTHLSDGGYPTGALSADETAEKLKNAVTAHDLMVWAEARVIPHWRVNGGPPLFKISEVRRWLAENAIERIEGDKLPIELRIVVDERPYPDEVPRPLMALKNLCSVQTMPCIPGVYFLIDDDDIVYVGQSVNVMARISAHMVDKAKGFSRALYLPLPEYALLDVERYFIKTLLPPLNRETWRKFPITEAEKEKARRYVNVDLAVETP